MTKGAQIGLFLGIAAGIATLIYSQRSSASVPEDIADSTEENPTIDFGGSDVNWKTNEYPKYASAISDAESRYDIPTDLLARLLYQESHFRADIISGQKRSPVGAMGIGQFMPDTGKDYGLVLADGTDLRTDPFASIDAAGRYLSNLYGMFGDWKSALMAYNWGPGNVQRFNRGQTVTVPLETSTYVAQITADVPV